MLNAYKNLCVGNLQAVDKTFAFPLLRWLSGNSNNLEACEFIDTKFFNIPPQMVVSLLYLTTKKGFTKYPKKTAHEKDDKFYELVKAGIKKLYGWSEREYDKNKPVIEPLFGDKDFIKELAATQGYTAKECKVLGVKLEVKKYEYKPRPVGLSAFM